MEKQIFVFPKWLTALYAASAAILMPWTFFLAKNLPTRLLAHHWDIAWAGFDVLETLLLILTLILAIRRSIWLPLTATSLATVLLIDAWFDVLTSHPGKQQAGALLLALFVEVPIAILTFMFAYRTTRHLHFKLLSDNKS